MYDRRTGRHCWSYPDRRQCKINAQSGVSKSIKTPNTAVTGSPAFDYTSALRSQAVTRNLPELGKRIIELENLVKQLMTGEGSAIM